MPPKKPAADSPDPSDSSSSEEPLNEKPEGKADAAAHPSTAIMVKEALQALDSRKGVSSQAILKYINDKYPSVDPVRLKTLVRKNLKKGLETGTLVKPGNSSATAGSRKVRLAPQAKPKTTENGEASVKKSPKAAKDAAKDGAKKLSKAGATKKKDAANGQTASKEDSKPPKRSKKDEEATTSKVPPAKRPKAKKAEVNGAGEESSNATTTKAKQTKKAETGKAKVAKVDSTVPASKAKGKRGAKAAE